MTAITARYARQAASLFCGRPAAGRSALAATKIEITADLAKVPAGVGTHGNTDQAATAELAASAGSPTDLRRCRHDG